MTDASPPRLTRCLVLAAAALDRRALTHLDLSPLGVEFAAVCASPSATRDRLRREALDLVVLDELAGTAEELSDLTTLAQSRGVRVSIYRGRKTPEETVKMVLGFMGLGGGGPQPEPEPQLAPPPPRRAVLTPSLVVIGSSTGGPEALGELLPRLPSNFQPPVLIAQHMPAAFTNLLARRLEEQSALSIKEAENGELLRAGHVFIAPGDYHMEVSDDGLAVRLHQGPPEHSCRPAVDPLFRSAAKVFRERVLGVVLTGMGRDGCEGARHLRERGAEVFVQDESSSVVWGMPGFIAREGLATRTGTLVEIASWLTERSLLKLMGSSEEGTR